MWALEQDLLEAKDASVELDAGRRRQLHQALTVCPDLTEALEALSEDCLERHRQALMERQLGLARSIQAEALDYLQRLPQGNRVRDQGLDYVQGERRIKLQLPVAMSVEIGQFKTQMKRLVPERIGLVTTAEVDLQLPVGSYLLTFESPGYARTKYPVYLEHGQDWDTTGPTGTGGLLPLPHTSDVGPEDRYVPEGWFYAGGDPDAPNGKAQTRLWLDGFIIRETPVTHAQYLEFINDLHQTRGLEEANLWLPREQSTSESELGKPIYMQKDNVFEHSLGPEMNNHPVVHVTWYQAVAFTQWLAQKTKEPWRLPLELEWEKAARGVDRRCFPWGSQFDPMFCVMMDSHVGKPEIRSLDDIQMDMSLYGVRSLAGNTREWCLDLFYADDYRVEQGRAVMPSDADLTSEEFRSCRGGSYGNAATRTRSGDRDWWFPSLSYVGRGFRIARSWPPTESSELLQNRIERAHCKTYETTKSTHAVAAYHVKKKIEHATSQLREQADQLKELDRQKTMFFQNMSHELRTPLTLILGSLEESNKRHTADRDLAVATKNARRLLRLVNQLLDFQKLEAGKKELKLVPLNLNRFTHVLGDYFASACSSKDIEFQVNRDGKALQRDDVVCIESEPDALEKVTFNFLSNALKYTPRGGSIELGLRAQPNQRVRLFVRDSGPGISEEGQAKLFQVFSQVEGSTTREYEGTGLGLALAKSLVEEMGGEVGVESKTGAGSTFFAEFPLVDTPSVEGNVGFDARDWLLADAGETGVDIDVEDEFEVDPDTEGAGQLVLVVDDLEDMRNLIGRTLRRRGYRVLKAANGEQGYSVICERRPDLVISDWMMPKLSGPDMLRRVRENVDIATTPVILLTAKSDEESKLIGTQIGADVFLGKPFNDQELGSAVRNLLGLKSREKEVQKLNDYITESVLKRYLPPALIGDILSGKLSMDKPAELREITVLFSDIKDFTVTSETLGPEGISAFLNEYLTVMNEVIFEHEGTIDKFIGDAIMVLFGAPQDMSPQEQVRRASTCAKAMQRAMTRLNYGPNRVTMRIGIHQGKAVVGNFGSTQRSDYTAIGPTVNLAARIESACVPNEVYVSEHAAKLMDACATDRVGEFDLKGIDSKVSLYRVV